MKEYNLNKNYRKAFVLTPDRLVKLIEVITSGLRRAPGDISVAYSVNRMDGTNYSSATLDQILGDSNISGHKIESISIEITDPSAGEDKSLRGWIRFDADPATENPVTVSVYDSRPSPVDDSIASDLLPFVERCLVGSERKMGVPKWVHAFLLPTGLLAAVYLTATKYIPQFNRPISELSFSTFALQMFVCFFVGIGAYAMCSDLEIPKTWHKFLGKQSVFAWGDEAAAYRRREAIRDKLMWVVIIGLGVSLVAGFLGSWLFRAVFGN